MGKGAVSLEGVDRFTNVKLEDSIRVPGLPCKHYSELFLAFVCKVSKVGAGSMKGNLWQNMQT
jgi:hypothetical protein